jgi:hypothetical protein
MADPVLALPDHAKPVEVHTDASDYARGGVLMQEGTQSPINKSRKLNETERKYTVQEKEMAAMSQDEEEVLSSSWSGSSEGGEFPNLREPKEKRVQSSLRPGGSGYQSGSVPRRPQRKRQGGRRGHYGKSIPGQRNKSRHLKCVLYFYYRA